MHGPGRSGQDGRKPVRERLVLYQTTGPKFKGTDMPTDFHYFNWVDRHGVLGFGDNIPMATGSNSDSITFSSPRMERDSGLIFAFLIRWASMPAVWMRAMTTPISTTGFQGWKDRAIWSNYGTHFVWHIEGGKGIKGKEVKFQVRPNPLAR